MFTPDENPLELPKDDWQPNIFYDWHENASWLELVASEDAPTIVDTGTIIDRLN